VHNTKSAFIAAIRKDHLQNLLTEIETEVGDPAEHTGKQKSWRGRQKNCCMAQTVQYQCWQLASIARQK